MTLKRLYILLKTAIICAILCTCIPSLGKHNAFIIETVQAPTNIKHCNSKNGYYIVFQLGNNISVSKCNDNNQQVWQRSLQINNTSIRLTAVVENQSSNLVVLYNNLSNTHSRFGIAEVDGINGNILQTKEYSLSNTNFQASSIRVGSDGNYYIGANILSGSDDFNKGVFIGLNKSSLAVVFARRLSENRLAVYDVEQLNNDEWIIAGTYLTNHYKALVIKYNLTTDDITSKYFDLATSHNNVDKVAIDKATETIFIASSLWDNVQEDVSFTKLNADLVIQEHIRSQTTSPNINERIYSMVYVPTTNSILASGKWAIGNYLSFITNYFSDDWNHPWSKSIYAADDRTPPYGFNVSVKDTNIVYSTIMDDKVHYGVEPYSADDSECFIKSQYNADNQYFDEGPAFIFVSTQTINEMNSTMQSNNASYEHKGACGVSSSLDTGYFIPNAFSPNADGVNDFFFIYGPNITVLELSVFNRWGEKLFEGNSQNNFTWDGMFMGKPVENETYIYIGSIQLSTGAIIPIRGDITVTR